LWWGDVVVVWWWKMCWHEIAFELTIAIVRAVMIVFVWVVIYCFSGIYLFLQHVQQTGPTLLLIPPTPSRISGDKARQRV
jgi:hypothetical protein